MLRNTYLEINEDAYRHNINYLKQVSNKKLIAVIKANAYGAIDYKCAKIATQEGVDMFAVSSLDEALNLRKHDIKGEILILGYVDFKHLKLVKENDLIITCVSYDYAKELIKYDIENLKVHLKIDTGMHRIGLNEDNAKHGLELLLKAKAHVNGIYTHYACSDFDDNFTNKQFSLFKKILSSLNYQFEFIHTCNTDATIHFNDDISTHVRCGLGLLGLSTYDSKLRQVLSLYSHIDNIKTLKKGDGISYSQTYICQKDEIIATLPIGYADGLLRHNKNRKVFINNKFATIVGNICMDQMMIKLEENANLNDKVEIFGNHIKITDIAKDLDTIPYEIYTGITDRVTRLYVNDNHEILDEITPRYEK